MLRRLPPCRLGGWLGLILLLTALPASVGARQSTRVVVSAASSLTDVLSRLVDLYEETGADVRVELNLAGSNTLARQIIAGAPVDLFLSANVDEMRRLETAGRVRPNSWDALLSNQLVVVTPDDRPAPPRRLDDLRAAGVRRIAIGDPAAVPAGIYARRVLEARGIWNDLAGKLVPTRSVRAALAAVETGNVDAAFVYRTDAASAPRAVVAFEIPLAEAPAIIYPVAVIEGSPNGVAATAFLRFLRSASARAVFEQAGFIVVASRGGATVP